MVSDLKCLCNAFQLDGWGWNLFFAFSIVSFTRLSVLFIYTDVRLLFSERDLRDDLFVFEWFGKNFDFSVSGFKNVNLSTPDLEETEETGEEIFQKYTF